MKSTNRYIIVSPGKYEEVKNRIILNSVLSTEHATTTSNFQSNHRF